MTQQQSASQNQSFFGDDFSNSANMSIGSGYGASPTAAVRSPTKLNSTGTGTTASTAATTSGLTVPLPPAAVAPVPPPPSTSVASNAGSSSALDDDLEDFESFLNERS
jgi:hypothetical protein